MAVIFDEVVATIEPPVSRAEEPAASEDASAGEDTQKKVVQILETQQRRAKRLLAE